MIYDRLAPREKELVDLVMSNCAAKYERLADAIGRRMGISRCSAKSLLQRVHLKYGIDSERYSPTVRLVYLRAKELNLL